MTVVVTEYCLHFTTSASEDTNQRGTAWNDGKWRDPKRIQWIVPALRRIICLILVSEFELADPANGFQAMLDHVESSNSLSLK
jgi:hypothetical protein